MLTVIAVRNLIEMSGSDFAFLPKSFIKGKGNVETILSVSDYLLPTRSRLLQTTLISCAFVTSRLFSLSLR